MEQEIKQFRSAMSDKGILSPGHIEKVVNIHDREREMANHLGMTLQDYLKRKAILLAQVDSLKNSRGEKLGMNL